MIRVLVIPAWYDIQKPLVGIFFHDYCNAMTNYCDVTLFNVVPKSFSERFKKQNKEDAIKHKKYHFIKMDFYNPFPGFFFRLSYKIQKKMMVLKAVNTINNLMKQHGKFDVIHIQSVCNNITPIIAIALSKKFNIPYVITEHYTSFKEAGEANYLPYTSFAEIKNIVINSSLRIAVSNFASNYCANCFGAKFETVYNIISNNFEEINLKQKNNKETHFNFLCIGNLTKRKGQIYLLQAFAQIADEFKNMTLTFIGKDDEQQTHFKLATELGIIEKINFYSYLPNNKFIDVMDAANVIVSASEAELFGLTIVEGFFRGKPSLATRSGGPEELINESNGLITNYADISGMVKNMKSIYENYENYNSKKIRNDAINKFSEIAIGPIMIGHYMKVIAKTN